MREERIGKAGAAVGRDPIAMGYTAIGFLSRRDGIVLASDAPKEMQDEGDEEWSNGVKSVMDLWMSVRAKDNARFSVNGIDSVNGKPVFGRPRPPLNESERMKELCRKTMKAGEARGVVTSEKTARSIERLQKGGVGAIVEYAKGRSEVGLSQAYGSATASVFHAS